MSTGRAHGGCAMTSPVDTAHTPPRANIVGTGLIGGSIGLGLRARGWYVTGRDVEGARAARAVELGALDTVGEDPGGTVTFIATPVSSIVEEAKRALRHADVVTDVGG